MDMSLRGSAFLPKQPPFLQEETASQKTLAVT